MLLVVFGHVLTHCLRNYSEDSVVYCFFERFRMPMFFFISGYIAYKAAEHWDFSLFRTMLKKKAIVQLIPTFIFFSFWGIVYNNNLWEIFMKMGQIFFGSVRLYLKCLSSIIQYN
ncbi:acyltransferase family protein [Bacteroides fragilis]